MGRDEKRKKNKVGKEGRQKDKRMSGTARAAAVNVVRIYSE